jgi:CheY-like chemotaxis protein
VLPPFKEDAAVRPKHSKRSKIMSNKPESILIVDDCEVLRSSLVYLFTACGFKVREASDGFGALAQIKSELPDILISDLNMPGMCGFELLSIVRRRFPSIGVVATSGAYSGSAIPAGVAADAFYPKGGESIGSLFGVVNALVERAGTHRSRSVTPTWIHQFAIDRHPESTRLSRPEERNGVTITSRIEEEMHYVTR